MYKDTSGRSRTRLNSGLTGKLTGGMTLVEILVALIILAIIGSIGVSSFINARTAKQLDVLTDAISSKLEENKAAALAGKNEVGHGVKFNPDSYVSFNGDAYNPSDADNITYALPYGWAMTNTINNADDSIAFARITGSATATGTITIYNTQNSSLQDSITVGSLGNITVTK